MTTTELFDLAAGGSRVALLLPGGVRLSYAELHARVRERAAGWGPVRRLVLVEGANRLDPLVSYLAALEGGHVALVVPHDRPEQRDAMVAAYDPDVVCSTTGDQVRRAGSAHDLHPDLALLLSTSGSTGSPKLVRLSRGNVASNAAAIAEYLRLGPDDRAVTTLPLHYCYGLSVLHSHLLAGASVALTELSVVDPCFWDLFTRVGATSLAGVPHTFELLERSGFADRHLPSLRQVTQAGGRLAPERVRALARLGASRGWELVVMYGQTEATARMAWLPPSLAAEHPGAVGVAIPGGRLRVEPVPEATDPGVGELVYTGPNVMMGYAATPADLARGAEVTELRTGDLGRERDGLLEVVGRRARRAKVFGLRLDLDLLEQRLESEGLPAHCTGEERHLHAFVTDAGSGEAVRLRLAELAGLPAGAVRVHALDALPLTASGKVDRAALTELAEVAEVAGPAEPVPDAAPRAAMPGALVDQLVAQYALVLGQPTAGPRDTFVGLGGDSLSFVELATRLERLLACDLPPGWHVRPVAELAGLAGLARPTDPAEGAGPAGRPGSVDPSGSTGAGPARAGRQRLDVTVALRALAIVLIVASHVDLVGLEGGAHLLLVLAGFNFARFQLGSPDRRERLRNGLASLVQLVVPSVLWIGGVGLLLGAYHPATALLLNQVLGSREWTDQWQFWFLEALAWLWLGSLALLAVPAVHRVERRHPLALPVALVLVTATVRFSLVGLQAGPTERYTTWVVASFFALGWAASRATTGSERLLVAALGLATVPGFFGDAGREAIVLAGLVVLLWPPRLSCPAPVARAAETLAGASLFVYLTQWQVYPPLEDAGHPVAALLAALAVGIAYARLMRPLQRRLARACHRRRPAPARTHLSVGGTRTSALPAAR
ncbi:AMP-binding protein [Nocardioides solisilvae]|uniref:AMP-binding protein n=1 Tax=Nocardioides solisilvae TaxID=1542435 RepID=UPI000D744E3D|nr:AMP-binding protein [Nocardioides solisilvae]